MFLKHINTQTYSSLPKVCFKKTVLIKIGGRLEGVFLKLFAWLKIQTMTCCLLKKALCLDLRKVFASTLRQNVLNELSKTREIRVMKLVDAVGSTYNELNRNLEILEKEGIITNDYRVKVRHGKVRVIRLNRDNPKTKILLQALKTLDNENYLID